MTKGFFITISELRKPRKPAASIGMKWSGLPVEAPRGWKVIY
ncbi:MAG: hypothetical protein JWO78_9, partial [Micavibrio sp.]|nr:hypothetical protein [Micavibrio sp.]